jgi:hypothetical protein
MSSHLAQLLPSASELLSVRYGRTVELTGPPEVLQENPVVARLRVSGGPVRSVVLKSARLGPDGAFDPADAVTPRGTAAFWNEWAGLEFLSELGVPVPEFLGGDRELGFLLMEDLGAHPGLADLLIGSDAEAAYGALGGYVDALAEIHLATFGRAPEYRAARAALGPLGPAGSVGGDGPEPQAEKIRAALLNIDAPIDRAAVAEACDWVDANVVHHPGPYLALSLTDCCPDNNVVRPDGTVRLLDAEGTAVRHALLDLAYLHTSMPTCWCLARFPAALAEELTERYRKRLAAAGHSLPGFDAALDACRAYWALLSLERDGVRAFSDPQGVERINLAEEGFDFTVPSSRDRVLLRATELAEVAVRRPELAPLAELAVAIRNAAEAAWPEVELLPVYPVFGGRHD